MTSIGFFKLVPSIISNLSITQKDWCALVISVTTSWISIKLQMSTQLLCITIGVDLMRALPWEYFRTPATQQGDFQFRWPVAQGIWKCSTIGTLNHKFLRICHSCKLQILTDYMFYWLSYVTYEARSFYRKNGQLSFHFQTSHAVQIESWLDYTNYAACLRRYYTSFYFPNLTSHTSRSKSRVNDALLRSRTPSVVVCVWKFWYCEIGLECQLHEACRVNVSKMSALL